MKDVPQPCRSTAFLNAAIRALALAAFVAVRTPARGEAEIEGLVKLPVSRAAQTAPPRYQGSRITPAAPDPPMAAVYLEGAFPATPAPRPVVELKQRNLQFSPNLLVIEVGTSVRFPNLDGEHHSVLSYSRAKRLDLGRYTSQDNPPVHVFDKPGVVDLNCDIHQFMRANIIVVQTPYFTTTDSEGGGRFKLQKLPAGKFVLRAWVSPKVSWSQPVELKDGAKLTVNFPGSPPAP